MYNNLKLQRISASHSDLTAMFTYDGGEDNVATILAANYFLSAKQLKDGDLVFVHASDASGFVTITVKPGEATTTPVGALIPKV